MRALHVPSLISQSGRFSTLSFANFLSTFQFDIPEDVSHLPRHIEVDVIVTLSVGVREEKQTRKERDSIKHQVRKPDESLDTGSLLDGISFLFSCML